MAEAFDELDAAAEALAATNLVDSIATQKALWRVATATAPFLSAPYRFLLDPLNRLFWPQICAESLGLTLLRQKADNLLKHERLSRKITGAPEGNTNSSFIEPEPPDMATRYLLDIVHHAGGLDDIPIPPNAVNIAEVVHLALYIAFNRGEICTFAKEVCKRTDFNTLSTFWQAFLSWHAGKRDEETSAMLLQVLADKDVKAGMRKAALLLSWSESGIGTDDLVKLTGKHKFLLKREVAYTGSGPLPVLPQYLPSSQSPEEAFKELARLVKGNKGEKGADYDKKTKTLLVEILGAVAELPDFPLPNAEYQRALITGGGRDERQAVTLTLAAIIGMEPGELTAWSSTYIDANLQSIQCAAVEFSQAGTEMPEILSQIGSGLLAQEVQDWDKKGIAALVEILLPRTGGVAWEKPVIGSRNVYAGGCQLCAQMTQEVHVIIPPLQSRIRDISLYVAEICRQQSEDGVIGTHNTEIADAIAAEYGERTMELGELMQLVKTALRLAKEDGKKHLFREHIVRAATAIRGGDAAQPSVTLTFVGADDKGEVRIEIDGKEYKPKKRKASAYKLLRILKDSPGQRHEKFSLDIDESWSRCREQLQNWVGANLLRRVIDHDTRGGYIWLQPDVNIRTK
jgi:hypothetical protein